MRRLLDNAEKRMDRRHSENRKSTSTSRIPSINLPERLKGDDDAQLDVSAPPGGALSREGNMHYMHHSIFSMIAAVGSRSDFHARFDESSESDGETEEAHEAWNPSAVPPWKRHRDVASSEQNGLARSTLEGRGRTHRGSLHDRLMPTLPRLSISRHRSKSPVPPEGPSTTSDEPSRLTPTRPTRSRSVTPRAAPILSRMVEAQARFDGETSATKRTHGPIHEASDEEEPPRPSSSSLSTRLMEIFGFETPENVIVEYSCSLVQSMLLQGYMYVTEGHVCFYAYLPKKSTVAIKSGYLSKRGRNNPRYKRYWFSLKGDVFSYYKDWSNLYFPHGHVDLRYGISASLAEQKGKDKDVKDFQVTTDKGTFYFRADSSASAREWVKALQKVIFRTHNDGDSVKISFPIDNIIDIEESPMVDFADTFKIRVVETGETYGIDEVCVQPDLVDQSVQCL